MPMLHKPKPKATLTPFFAAFLELIPDFPLATLDKFSRKKIRLRRRLGVARIPRCRYPASHEGGVRSFSPPLSLLLLHGKSLPGEEIGYASRCCGNYCVVAARKSKSLYSIPQVVTKKYCTSRKVAKEQIAIISLSLFFVPYTFLQFHGFSLCLSSLISLLFPPSRPPPSSSFISPPSQSGAAPHSEKISPFSLSLFRLLL